MARNPHLEGPKKHHDSHGMDASVPGKKGLPQEHWEEHYDPHPRSTKIDPANAFCPHRGQDRAKTYTKVNATDH